MNPRPRKLKINDVDWKVRYIKLDKSTDDNLGICDHESKTITINTAAEEHKDELVLTMTIIHECIHAFCEHYKEDSVLGV